MRAKPDGIILREKDLEEAEALEYAKRCQYMAETYHVPFGINGFPTIAQQLHISWLHLSVDAFRKLKREEYSMVNRIGVSVHTVEEAIEMEQLGASYLIAGHIFPTDCKKGLPARGITFLQEICNRVMIPVFAIGGITKERKAAVLNTGAVGYCVMSELMSCESPKKIIEDFRES